MLLQHGYERSSTSRLRSNVAQRNIDRTYTARLASNPEVRRDAYELRHTSYSRSGFIEARPDGLFSDKYDRLPSAHTIVVYDDGRAVGSVRVCLLDIDDIDAAPAGVTFPEEVRELLFGLPRRPGRAQAAEITRLVRSPQAENDQGLVFLLLRAAGYIVLEQDVQLVLSCVRRNHVPFYRRLGNHIASDFRPYPGLNCQMQMLACPRAKYDATRAAFPILDPFAGGEDHSREFLAGAPVEMTLIPGR